MLHMMGRGTYLACFDHGEGQKAEASGQGPASSCGCHRMGFGLPVLFVSLDSRPFSCLAKPNRVCSEDANC